MEIEHPGNTVDFVTHREARFVLRVGLRGEKADVLIGESRDADARSVLLSGRCFPVSGNDQGAVYLPNVSRPGPTRASNRLIENNDPLKASRRFARAEQGASLIAQSAAR
jgi:hypothetical protein